MDWIVGAILVGAIIYWFFHRDPEDPPTPDKYQEKPRTQHKFERSHNIAPEAAEKRNISGLARTTTNTPLGNQVLAFQSNSLKDLLQELALAGRHEYDKPNAYIRIEFDRQSIGISTKAYNSALASYKPMIKEAKALLRKAQKAKPLTVAGLALAAVIDEKTKELQWHEDDLYEALDMVWSENGKAYDKLESVGGDLDEVRYDLEAIAEEIRFDEDAEEHTISTDPIAGTGTNYEISTRVWSEDAPMFFDKRYKNDPWYGKQYRNTGDPDDKPNSFASWDLAFNRQITDELWFEITYADADGVVTDRKIRPISIHLLPQRGDLFIRAYCAERDAERTFYSSRIQRCINLQTKRRLSNLGQYLRGRF